jgi:hypothetical protein
VGSGPSERRSASALFALHEGVRQTVHKARRLEPSVGQGDSEVGEASALRRGVELRQLLDREVSVSNQKLKVLGQILERGPLLRRDCGAATKRCEGSQSRG